MLRLLGVTGLSLGLVLLAPAHAAERVALVVGNSSYQAVPKLDNPANDAKLMAETLTRLGFTLVGGSAQLDLDKAGFDQAVQAFGSALVLRSGSSTMQVTACRCAAPTFSRR